MRKNLMYLCILICFIITSVLLPDVVYGKIPEKINFQGLLTDNSGNPLSGSHELIFKIYSTETSGTPLWEETQTVNVSSGIFSVQLGNVTPIGIDIFNSVNRWLEIVVEGTPLSPRQQFYSHPYSYFSEKTYGIAGTTITGTHIVDGSITGVDIDPQGDIIISMLTVGSGTTGIIKHRTYDALTFDQKKMAFYENEDGATFNMGGNKISYIGPKGPSGSGMTLTGDANDYMRIYVASAGWSNSGLYIGAEGNMATEKIDMCSDNVFCWYRFYPGTTGTGGWQNNNYIVADSGNPGSSWIRTNAQGFTLGGNDVAELMLTDEPLEAGEVAVINHNKKLVRCNKEYDTCLVGVISEKAGIVLGAGVSKSTTGNMEDGYPVALNGRVYVKTDASYGPINIGDLLTTSPTPGHAMKAKLDSWEKFSSIVGKALESIDSGKGKILVLVNTH